MFAHNKKRRIALFGLLVVMLIGIVFLHNYIQQEARTPKVGKEFEIQGVTWRTISYYYHPGIYDEMYNRKSNLSIIKKAKDVGANYLLIRAFYNGAADGGLIGNDIEAERSLAQAITMAHNRGMQIFLTPYVESRDYLEGKWALSEEVWSATVLKWAEFAENNDVEMFAPGVEMNLILDKEKVGVWYKEILPEIRKVYSGKVVTAEHFDIERWRILDEAQAFTGYDCIGLTVFPRKEYGGVSDMRSVKDYDEYVENEAETIDMLSEKYDIPCKLAIPIGLDYWQGSYPESPIPDADIVADVTDSGLDILKRHNFTGVFIAHWASELDHFGTSEDVEIMLKKRWVETN